VITFYTLLFMLSIIAKDAELCLQDDIKSQNHLLLEKKAYRGDGGNSC
jgi:hypothetical protein